MTDLERGPSSSPQSVHASGVPSEQTPLKPSGEMKLPELPDDHADFTPELALEICGLYREIIGHQSAEIERLRRDCAELYQVIGTLASAHVDIFDHPQVVKALDNASAAANGDPRPHDDLLPFTPIKIDDPLLTAESALAGAMERAAKIAETTPMGMENHPQKIASAIRAASSDKTAESGHSPSTLNTRTE